MLALLPLSSAVALLQPTPLVDTPELGGYYAAEVVRRRGELQPVPPLRPLPHHAARIEWEAGPEFDLNQVPDHTVLAFVIVGCGIARVEARRG